MPAYNEQRYLKGIPLPNEHLQLCHSRDKSIVWLELTYFTHLPTGWMTAFIGAFQRNPASPWEIIDSATAFSKRDFIYAFGESESFDVIEFQSAILKQWATFSSGNFKSYLNEKPKVTVTGQTPTYSSASFVMGALITGLRAVNKPVRSLTQNSSVNQSGTNWTADDVLASLKLYADNQIIKIVDPALAHDFKLCKQNEKLLDDEDKWASSDDRKLARIESVKPHGGKFAYSNPNANYKDRDANYLTSLSLPRINGYAFRGDSRPPSSIKAAGGMLPGATRDDYYQYMLEQIELKDLENKLKVTDPSTQAYKDLMSQKESIDISLRSKEYIDKDYKRWTTIGGHLGPETSSALNLHIYIKQQFMGGWVSLSKSLKIAKFFATGRGGTTTGGKGQEGWVYAIFYEGGVEIPAAKKTFEFNGEKGHVPYEEQEIAVPGTIDWDDIVACRKVLGSGSFTGHLYVRESLLRDDPKAFSAIFDALSTGKQSERK